MAVFYLFLGTTLGLLFCVLIRAGYRMMALSLGMALFFGILLTNGYPSIREQYPTVFLGAFLLGPVAFLAYGRRRDI
jgi:hypothetical protein